MYKVIYTSDITGFGIYEVDYNDIINFVNQVLLKFADYYINSL